MDKIFKMKTDISIKNDAESEVSENCFNHAGISKISIPMSPARTETSTSSVSILSENRSGIYASSEKPSSQDRGFDSRSTNKFASSNSTPSNKSSVRRCRSLVRNPITGAITQIMTNSPDINVSTLNRKTLIDHTKEQDEILEYKNFDLTALPKMISSSNIRRNPITGEGMNDFKHPMNIKNYLRSGIRINQPPGGISSGIF